MMIARIITTCAAAVRPLGNGVCPNTIAPGTCEFSTSVLPVKPGNDIGEEAIIRPPGSWMFFIFLQEPRSAASLSLSQHTGTTSDIRVARDTRGLW